MDAKISHSTDMDAKIRPWLFLSVLLPFSSSMNSLSLAAETISSGQSLCGDRTISSKGGIFELGFFRPGKSIGHYLGIWYKQLPERTVVWVANRETPVSDKYSCDLKINQDGNLVLLDPLKMPVWSTNISSIAANNTIAELLDTGNLVLRNGSDSLAIIWQSFDHPTHTLLPKAWIGRNKITRQRQRLTAWKTPEDPAPGLFSFEIDPNGTNQYLLMRNRSKVYWRSGVWNGQFFSQLPEMGSGQMLNFSFDDTENGTYFSYHPLNSSVFTRAIVDFSGQVKQCLWLEVSRQWSCIWMRPVAQCEVYSLCGSFGICTEKSQPFCSCLHGFEPESKGDWSLRVWSGGCVRKTRLQCTLNGSDYGEKDGFLLMRNLRLPANGQSSKDRSVRECELSCLSSCSCTGYAYNNGCSLWNRDLINLQQLSDGEGEDFYLRVAASELQGLGRRKKRITGVILGSVVGGAAVFGIITILLICRHRRWRQIKSLKFVPGCLLSFSYRDLQIITKNFSEKLGKGSFGSVFKGTLCDSTAIAVKKLEGHIQGEKQFRTEVSTIGVIQHINLIRLCGFCSQGTNRLLVYEYMPNGSLDSLLFQKSSRTIDWKMRYQIALGTARGLAYLHEKCRDRIIHCDVKPENVLLDAEFCPKVADFGMAKLVGREFSRVLTTMRGTIGYLAPEWISGVAVTPKADVYSYGMMLFEIISGKRNAEQLGDGESAFFPCCAAEKIANGEILDLLDHRLEGNADMEELSRVFRVAFWCIQDNEDDRPSMGNVVHILEGLKDVSMPPVPRSIRILLDNSW